MSPCREILEPCQHLEGILTAVVTSQFSGGSALRVKALEGTGVGASRAGIGGNAPAQPTLLVLWAPPPNEAVRADHVPGRRRGREAPLLQPLPLPLPLRELCPQRWCLFGAQKWSDRTVSSTLSPTEALVAQRLELIEGL